MLRRTPELRTLVEPGARGGAGSWRKECGRALGRRRNRGFMALARAFPFCIFRGMPWATIRMPQRIGDFRDTGAANFHQEARRFGQPELVQVAGKGIPHFRPQNVVQLVAVDADFRDRGFEFRCQRFRTATGCRRGAHGWCRRRFARPCPAISPGGEWGPQKKRREEFEPARTTVCRRRLGVGGVLRRCWFGK